MRASLLLIPLVLAPTGCRGVRSAPAAANLVRASADTADVLQAVWRAATPMFRGVGVGWFYLPGTDSARFTTSETVRATLVRRDIPASARRPAGYDTVVSQVRRWTSDSTGSPLIEFSSGWRHILSGGQCVLGGTTETYRIQRSRTGWEAEAVGPGLHGDGYCVPSGRRP